MVLAADVVMKMQREKDVNESISLLLHSAFAFALTSIILQGRRMKAFKRVGKRIKKKAKTKKKKTIDKQDPHNFYQENGIDNIVILIYNSITNNSGDNCTHHFVRHFKNTF